MEAGVTGARGPTVQELVAVLSRPKCAPVPTLDLCTAEPDVRARASRHDPVRRAAVILTSHPVGATHYQVEVVTLTPGVVMGPTRCARTPFLML